jgi:hypothetical protein
MKYPTVAGFTGTEHGMSESQKESVDHLLVDLLVKQLHHGDCVGADAEAHRLAKARSVFVVGHPPVDDKKRAFCVCDHLEPPLPYLERDRKIVDASQFLIAVPRQYEEVVRSGTWTTYRYARRRLKKVFLVTPDGLVWER